MVHIIIYLLENYMKQLLSNKLNIYMILVWFSFRHRWTYVYNAVCLKLHRWGLRANMISLLCKNTYLRDGLIVLKTNGYKESVFPNICCRHLRISKRKILIWMCMTKDSNEITQELLYPSIYRWTKSISIMILYVHLGLNHSGHHTNWRILHADIIHIG